MPATFGSSEAAERTTYLVIAVLVALAVSVVIAYVLFSPADNGCPKSLVRRKDGSLQLDEGQVFPDMNAFQQWWHAPGGAAKKGCPLPILSGAREVEVMHQEDENEQMWAKTPIYKVDDYEFSRVFGIERNGHMDVPRQNFNMILNERLFDWADKPMSSDERRSKYRGLTEGFTATGDLKSIVMGEPSAEDLVKEATSRYGERRHLDPRHPRNPSKKHHEGNEDEEDIDCHLSREAKEVAAMVAKSYENDPNFEPVVTKVGPHQWEVNELKPRRRHGEVKEEKVDERVVNTDNDAVDVHFKYRENKIVEDAIDPYFPESWGQNERKSSDPYYGPVPNMERMFGPTFDRTEWYHPGKGPFTD
jgi:hypothetical protein